MDAPSTVCQHTVLAIPCVFSSPCFSLRAWTCLLWLRLLGRLLLNRLLALLTLLLFLALQPAGHLTLLMYQSRQAFLCFDLGVHVVLFARLGNDAAQGGLLRVQTCFGFG